MKSRRQFGEHRNGVEVKGAWGCLGGTKRLSKLVFKRLISPAPCDAVEKIFCADEPQVLILRGRVRRLDKRWDVNSVVAALEDHLLSPVKASLTPFGRVAPGGYVLLLPDTEAISAEVAVSMTDSLLMPRESMFATSNNESVRVIRLGKGDALLVSRGVPYEVLSKDSMHCLEFMPGWTRSELIASCVAETLDMASDILPSLRRTIPPRVLNRLGAGKAKQTTKLKAAIKRAALNTMKDTFSQFFNVDFAADSLLKKFFSSRSPPPIALADDGSGVKVNDDTSVRLIFRSAARVVLDAWRDSAQLLYCTQRGSGTYNCTAEEALAVDFLCKVYPKWVPTRALPLEDASDRIGIVAALRDVGILAVEAERPLVEEWERAWFSPQMKPGQRDA